MNSQKSVKIKFGIVIALALAFFVTLGAFIGVTVANAKRDVTISGSSIFVTTGNAQVWAHKDGTGDEAKDYTMFVLTKDGDSKSDEKDAQTKDAVSYRKNLAFKWFENSATQPEVTESEGEGEEASSEAQPVNFTKAEGWFNMEIGFTDENNKDGNLQFEKFVITFESQQYSQTKDGKSVNYLIFVNNANRLSVYVAHKEDADKDIYSVFDRLSDNELLGEVENDHVKIAFTDYRNGNYTVKVNELVKTGLFENVGKTYARYSSSSTTPVTPLSFKAFFKEEDESVPDGDSPEMHGNALMTLYGLNGQSFELSDTNTNNGYLAGGKVNDDTPPVLCLDKEVPFIKYNGEITFDYTVIDVLTSSPSLTTSYYMLTKADAEAGKLPTYVEDGGDYKQVSDSDDQYMHPHGKHYVPQAADLGSAYNSNFEVKAAVKVALKLTDTTSTGGQTTYVLLDWFVNDKYLVKLGGDVNKAYLAVATDKQGVYYNYTDVENKTSDPTAADWVKAVEEYQAKVDEAAKDLKAGNKNYFYLPSVESLIADDATEYQDLTFSIYYNNGSQQQSTGKTANGLSINLTKAEKYVFTVYATDAAGNSPFYYDGDGEAVEISTGDVWKIYAADKDGDFAGMKNYLPWFEFEVEESEISIEDPDEQSTAYVGSSFTPDNFDINGVSVNTVYTLYEFENDRWAQDHGTALTFEQFEAQKETLLSENRNYFTRIRPSSELKEGTADYEKFNAYGWNGNSLTFTPQTANAFYLVKCEASSSKTDEPVTKLMTVAAAPKVAPLKGEDTWVQDNVTSIVLLCIAGACLVGIVLLIVIKPKNKGDVDEIIDTPHKRVKRK